MTAVPAFRTTGFVDASSGAAFFGRFVALAGAAFALWESEPCSGYCEPNFKMADELLVTPK